MVTVTERQLAHAAIITVIFVFVLFHMFSWLLRKNGKFFPRNTNQPLVLRDSFYLIKITGFVLTGVVPFLLFKYFLNFNPVFSGFTTGKWPDFMLLTLILVLLTLLFSFFSSRSPSIWERVPELKIKFWKPGLMISTSLFWMIYLFGYEFLFRGILWFTSYNAFGFLPALVINLILYSAAHLPQGRLMVIGSIPVGIIFCALSHYTGSFLPAFLIHTVMACSTEIFVIYHNPELNFRKTI